MTATIHLRISSAVFRKLVNFLYFISISQKLRGYESNILIVGDILIDRQQEASTKLSTTFTLNIVSIM